jgi:hypothetical protein
MRCDGFLCKSKSMIESQFQCIESMQDIRIQSVREVNLEGEDCRCCGVVKKQRSIKSRS